MFDFASPNAYLAYRALPPILARTGAELVIAPCLLGGLFKATDNQPPMAAFARRQGQGRLRKAGDQALHRQHGLTKFRMNPHFPVNTLMLMRGLVAARRARRSGRLSRNGPARPCGRRGLKLDDTDVLARRSTAAGLDGAATARATPRRPEVKTEPRRDDGAAVARGAFGIPTFFVGEEMFFGKERLAQVEEELARIPA